MYYEKVYLKEVNVRFGCMYGKGGLVGWLAACAAVLCLGHDLLLEVPKGFLDLASLELLVIQARLKI